MTHEMITFTKEAGMMLLDMLHLEPICHFCKCEINEENLGSIYSKPTVVVCNSLVCISELIGTDESD